MCLWIIGSVLPATSAATYRAAMMSTGANVANTIFVPNVLPTAENVTHRRASAVWKTAPYAMTPYAQPV